MIVIRCKRGWCPNLTDFIPSYLLSAAVKYTFPSRSNVIHRLKIPMRFWVCLCCIIYWSLALLNEGRTVLWHLQHEIAVAAVTMNMSAGVEFCSPPTAQFKHHQNLMEWLCCRSIVLVFKAVVASYSRPIVASSCASSSSCKEWLEYFRNSQFKTHFSRSLDLIYWFLRTYVDP